jgi:hypothetical protein
MENKFNKVLSLLLLSLITLSSCATLFKGNSEQVTFNSTPAGVQVIVNGVSMGATPLNLKLESGKDYTVEFRKEGLESKTFQIPKRIGAHWVVLDVIGGFVPVIVDAVTGSWYQLETNAISATLEESPAA